MADTSLAPMRKQTDCSRRSSLGALATVGRAASTVDHDRIAAGGDRPLLGLMLNVELHAAGWLALTLAAGTPAFTFIGLVGAALSVALRRGRLLLAVLVLPLTVPVLIFGVAATNAAILGSGPFGPPFTILCALSLAGLVLGPIAAAAALRHGLE